MKPTDEQKKELLEWCGFTLRCPPERDAYKRGIWNYPDGMTGDVELDLNNLFKYAVPKLAEGGRFLAMIMATPNKKLVYRYIVNMVNDDMDIGIEKQSEDPALALFWAIWEVMGEKC